MAASAAVATCVSDPRAARQEQPASQRSCPKADEHWGTPKKRQKSTQRAGIQAAEAGERRGKGHFERCDEVVCSILGGFTVDTQYHAGRRRWQALVLNQADWVVQSGSNLELLITVSTFMNTTLLSAPTIRNKGNRCGDETGEKVGETENGGGEGRSAAAFP
eukprot:2496058-Rhodomonas_salina.4